MSTKKINRLDAYFVNGRMFASISGPDVGLRLPVVAATELQFRGTTSYPFSQAACEYP